MESSKNAVAKFWDRYGETLIAGAGIVVLALLTALASGYGRRAGGHLADGHFGPEE
jgi:hypothetical protein